MTVAEILTKAGEREDAVLHEHAVLLSLAKLSRYQAECAAFAAKHGESFEFFYDRVNGMVNEERFDLDDDLMDWEFAHRARAWWQSRVEELRGAV